MKDLDDFIQELIENASFREAFGEDSSLVLKKFKIDPALCEKLASLDIDALVANACISSEAQDKVSANLGSALSTGMRKPQEYLSTGMRKPQEYLSTGMRRPEPSLTTDIRKPES